MALWAQEKEKAPCAFLMIWEPQNKLLPPLLDLLKHARVSMCLEELFCSPPTPTPAAPNLVGNCKGKGFSQDGVNDDIHMPFGKAVTVIRDSLA